MFGLSNSAVHRLYKTWEVRKHRDGFQCCVTIYSSAVCCLLQRIPSKTKRIYCAYERLMVSHNAVFWKLKVQQVSLCTDGGFSAPFRIPLETTGPTDWLWPSSVLLTSPSCRCCSKVADTWAFRWNVVWIHLTNDFLFLPIRRHDLHQWGKSKLCRQIGQFWETGKMKTD